MFSLFYRSLFVMVGLSLIPILTAQADSDGANISKGHREVSGVVTGEKSGLLTVKLPDGSTMTLNSKNAQQHGHEVPKVGDEVTLVLNENNAVIEAHPKGEKGHHQFITGKLVHVGLMKKEVKLMTSEGEKVFPIDRQEIKTGGLAEGTLVTVEVNEAGKVIDLHRAESGDKH